MGIGPQILELYRQLKILGALDGVSKVIELGSQDFWCPSEKLLRSLFAAFNKPVPTAELTHTSNSKQKPARLLYEGLGLEYAYVDVDGRNGALALDLNFDPTPSEHIGRYCLVTNHGTSEHLVNQYNVFNMVHDFTRVGGLMVHAVPFTVHVNHGFFNYQPNFFECLARYNSYETLGLWVGVDWQLASLIPWDPKLLDFLSFSSKTTHLLVSVLRKKHSHKFCVPFQEQYESMVPDEVRQRYEMVIDGDIMDGKRVKYLTKDELLAREYLPQIMHLKNRIDSYVGQIDGLKHELAATRQQLSRAGWGGLRSVGSNSDTGAYGLAASPLAILPLRDVPGRELLAEVGFRARRRVGSWLRPKRG